MSDKTLFFSFGPVLVVVAVAIAALGLRSQDFPSRRAIRIAIPLFAALVGVVMVLAVLNANSEPLGAENKAAAKQFRVHAQQAEARFADNPGGAIPVSGSPQTPAAQQQAPPGKTMTLSVNSPADGSLVYQPATLNASSGGVTINYKNPSPVPHSIAIAGPDGKTINQTIPGAMNSQSVSATLKPGKYVFFCTVPGHRQAGMQGTLTVK